MRSKLLHQPNSFVPGHLAHEVNAFESHMPIPYDRGGDNGNNNNNNNNNGGGRQGNGNNRNNNYNGNGGQYYGHYPPS